MKMNRVEPGLIQTFRYFTTIAVMYYSALVFFSLFNEEAGNLLVVAQAYLNLAANLFLFIWLSSRWLERKLDRFYLPVALLIASVVPIFSNLIYLNEPDLALLIERSWLLFPILIVPLTLIAWQYRFRIALAFIVMTALIEEIVLLQYVEKLSFQSLTVLGVPLIRAFAFGTVGHIVSHLMEVQRLQHDDLVCANQFLRQYAQTQEQLATSRERNRLARELHDTLAHTLSSQVLTLEAIQLKLPRGQREVRTMVEQSLVDVRSGLVETRRMLKNLRSKSLEDMGLSIALNSLVTEAACRAQFSADIRIPDDLPLMSQKLEQSVYRIVQEGLKNIVQHSEAANVRLCVWMEGRILYLEMVDDGRGFDLNDISQSDHFGLQGMRERASAVNGKLEITSKVGRGVRVFLAVEVNDDQDSNL